MSVKIKTSSLSGFLTALMFIFVLPGLLVGLWTERSLEWIFLTLKGEVVDVPYWLAAVLSMFVSFFGIAFNLVVELFRIAF